MEKTFELGQQTRKANFQAESINLEKRTIDVCWSTGVAVRRFDWQSFEVVNEELSLEKSAVRMDRLNSGAPVVNSHQTYDLGHVLGVVERAWLADLGGMASLRFHDDSQDKEPVVDPIWRKIANKIVRNVSVGYMVYTYRDVTAKGDAMRRLIAIDWEPTEISPCAVGADYKAGMRTMDQPKGQCRVISDDSPIIIPPVSGDAPAFDYKTLRHVDAAGLEISTEDFLTFQRTQSAAQQIPAAVQPDYRALRARLELLKVA